MRNYAFAIAIVLLCLVCLPYGHANLLITEILYDPVNEINGEAVELYNPTDSEINLDGYCLATESSQTDACLSGTIRPHHFFLVTDSGWNTSDGAAGPDHSETITMANTDSGVAVVFNNSVIDAVGWGNPDNIETGLFRARPASPAKEGFSLKRRLDENLNFVNTLNNSHDFETGEPELRNSSYSIAPIKEGQSDSIDIIVEIENVLPGIVSVSISGPGTVNNTLLPLPGRYTPFNVFAVVYSASMEGIHEVWFELLNKTSIMNLTGRINTTHSLFSATGQLPYWTPGGRYPINVYVSNNLNQTSYAAEWLEVLPVIGLEIDSETLQFSVRPGSTVWMEGDADMSTQEKPTIRNIGNSDFVLAVRKTEQSQNQSSVMLNCSINGLNYKVNSQITEFPSRILPGEFSLVPFSIGVTVPGNSSSGVYNARLSFIGFEAGIQ